jgi:hypothetical protein
MPWSAPIVAAEVILLFPVLALAFAGDPFAKAVNRLPVIAWVALRALAVIPYYLLTHPAGDFRWWLVERCCSPRLTFPTPCWSS